MRTLSALLLSSSLLVACGGDDGGSGPVIVTPDSPPAANCTVEASLGTVTPAQTQAGYQNDMMGMVAAYSLFAPVNADATPDIFVLELFKGYGAFMTSFPTSSTTIQLTGGESTYDSCGACVQIVADLDQQAQTTGPTYMANGGSITLTSVTTTSLAGSLSNVTLRHVDIADDTFATTDNPSGCTTTLASLAFSATPMAPMQRTRPDGTTVVGERWRVKLAQPAQ